MSISIFQKHPSSSLIELYKRKNYQGANPFDAKVIFVGKDPNWDIDIEESPIFDLVSDYLSDGIKFWQKHNIHHPFLHAQYGKEGLKYHNAIARLKFDNDLADKISFVEIIGFPTTGDSSKNPTLFYDYLFSLENRSNLNDLDQLFNDDSKLIFLYWGSIDLLKYINKKTGLFDRLKNIDKSKMVRTDLNKIGNIYFHKHFSMGISPETLKKISDEVKLNVSLHQN